MSAVVISDKEARQTAVHDSDRNLVVLAGAGTGKTRLLIDRLTYLILIKNISVDKIVALTFTKKAAEEMRSRLAARLDDLATGNVTLDDFEIEGALDEETLKRRAREAADILPRAPIGTIHSFAGHLLRLFPVQAGVDPQFREDDGTAEELIFKDRWQAFLKRELGRNAPRAAMWSELLAKVNLNEMAAVAGAMVNPHFRLEAASSSKGWSDGLSKLIQDAEEIVARDPVTSRAPKIKETLARLKIVFNVVGENKPVSSEDQALFSKFSARKRPAAWTGSESDWNRFQELVKTAQRLCRVNEKAVQEVQTAVLPFVQEVRRELKRTGVISFDALLVFARDLLRNHPAVREEIKKQFAVFLVDEFQDTDPLQGEILFYLAEKPSGNAKSWRDVQLVGGRLFVVGDPKQSIYRFRGADMAAFEEFRRAILDQGGKECHLVSNFRSAPSVLDSVNQFFPPVMTADPFIQPAYESLKPAREFGEGPGLEIHFVEPDEDGAASSAVYRLREAASIAEWIEREVKDSKTGRRFGDITLLFRSSHAFLEYIEEMKRRGIPYLAEGEKFFYQTPEISAFFNLMCAVARPTDTLALVGLLRSPLGGLTDLEIFELKQMGRLDFRSPKTGISASAKFIFDQLSRLYPLAHTLPVSDFLSRLITQFNVIEILSAGSHGDQAVANIRKLKQLAVAWGDRRPLTLTEFLERFEEYRRDEREEGENPLADANFDAVKLMTIHKSKGLEFPVVILPNLGAGQNSGGMDKPVFRMDWRRGWQGVRVPGLGAINREMFLIEEEHGIREKAEEVRVFYVAATRAKEKMIWFLRETKRGDGEFARLIRNAGYWPNGDDPATVSHKIVRIPWKEGGAAPPASVHWPLPATWETINFEQRQENRLAEYEQAKAPLLISPSYLINAEEKKANRDPDVDPEPSHAVWIGLVCHHVLEHWDFQTSSKGAEKAMNPKIANALAFFELTPEGYPGQEVAAECSSILKSFFKSSAYQILSQSKILGREVPFIAKGEKDEEFRRGIMDVLIEREGHLVVVDYKTNQVESSRLDELTKHYAPQAEIYKAALREIMGKPAQFELLFLRTGETVSI